jgi:phosphoribosylaminoimidazolecarboxamide formyltransferase/IMP cyclohydrolase
MALNIVNEIDDLVKVERVLVSVFDKSGLNDIIPALVELNPEIEFYSTGGTYTRLESLLGKHSEANLIRVTDYTGQPEMQGGLVKTLDFKIYLGLLSETYNQAHQDDLGRNKAVKFDMVIANLYPFIEVIGRAATTPEIARGNIDIGGPTMIRAAAKNFLRVAPLTDPADYSAIISELKNSKGFLSLKTRFNLARKAFELTSGYDRAIEDYLAHRDYQQLVSCYSRIK